MKTNLKKNVMGRQGSKKGQKPTTSPVDTLKQEVVRIAARLVKTATAPEYIDDMEWFKTTPLAERRRVVSMFRNVNEQKKVLATQLMAAIRNAKS
jgi:hypothetical protein